MPVIHPIEVESASSGSRSRSPASRIVQSSGSGARSCSVRISPTSSAVAAGNGSQSPWVAHCENGSPSSIDAVADSEVERTGGRSRRGPTRTHPPALGPRRRSEYEPHPPRRRGMVQVAPSRRREHADRRDGMEPPGLDVVDPTIGREALDQSIVGRFVGVQQHGGALGGFDEAFDRCSRASSAAHRCHHPGADDGDEHRDDHQGSASRGGSRSRPQQRGPRWSTPIAPRRTSVDCERDASPGRHPVSWRGSHQPHPVSRGYPGRRGRAAPP